MSDLKPLLQDPGARRGCLILLVVGVVILVTAVAISFYRMKLFEVALPAGLS